MKHLFAVLMLIAYLPAVSAGPSLQPEPLNNHDKAAVEQAIADGADVNAKMITGSTPLHFLVVVSADVGADPLRIVNGSIVRPGDWEKSGHQDIANLLLANGADVNSRDSDGKTPLQVAAITGHVQAAKWLLAHGADPTATDNKGRDALYYARWGGSDEAIKMLVDAGGGAVNNREIKRRAKVMESLLAQQGSG